MAREHPAIQTGTQKVTLTQLRKNIYQLVDEVIASGQPLTIKRGGSILKLDLVTQPTSKLGNLKARNTLVDDQSYPDDLEAVVTHQWDAERGFD